LLQRFNFVQKSSHKILKRLTATRPKEHEENCAQRPARRRGNPFAHAIYFPR
jgi:hypothetical protein